ncbi:unnamed protein product [Rotaria sordida]|uniref:Uncharacterized protein n=1 Tax=Rotaria sordida TaxID=392033 RepID=A0A815I0D6_9BILA|nr:unnamed protein product [Rotaria sordida]
MNDESDVLRPYPIDSSQDKVFRKIVFAKRDLIPRITSILFHIITYPLMILSKFLSKKSINEDGEEKSFSEIGPIYVSTRTNAMDSKYFYVVRDGKIWFKPIAAHPHASWKLFNKNGSIDNTKIPLISVSADGDNILAVDQNQIIHYAKSNEVICEVSFDCPQWKILESRVKWTEKWFNMDGVSLIVNLFKNPILKSLPNYRSIAMSHKGHDTMYYTDMKGKKHPDPYVGVTTIYILNDDGTRIFFADPWLQNKFDNELTTPEDGQFKAETMAASASTVFLIQRARNEYGKEINKIFTRFADFDSIGSNPALRATYNQNNIIPLIRIIPSEDWIEQPSIPLDEKARLTKNISILQIGWGQNNRQLRIQGQNHLGQNGYFLKNIYHAKWNFQFINNMIIDEDEFLSASVPHTGFERGPQIAFDYENGSLQPNVISPLQKITLEKFSHRGLNERGLHTKLVLVLNHGFKLSIPLYARRGWKSLLGISHENIWKLVIPLEYFAQDDFYLKEILEKIFHNRSRHSVYVYERKDQILITNVYFSRYKFQFIFKNKSN